MRKVKNFIKIPVVLAAGICFLGSSIPLEDLIFIIIAIISLYFGYFLFSSPLRAFEIQKRFYAMINWRIEPISLQKEIRNTKGMGIILIVIVLGSCIFMVVR